jgi:phage tail-like protein
VSRRDPILAYNFVITLIDSGSTLAFSPVDIQRSPLGGFSECSGLEMSLEVEEYKEGGNNGTVLKFPTRVTWGNLRLRRGVARFNDLWRWHYDFSLGRGRRRDGLVILQDDEQAAAKVWQFSKALPLKWTGPAMNAAQNQVAVEELEITHQGLKLLPASLSLTLGDVADATTGVVSAVEGLF